MWPRVFKYLGNASYILPNLKIIDFFRVELIIQIIVKGNIFLLYEI